MTPAPEKAAPIPAEAEKLANDLLAIANASVRADGTDIPLGETCRKAALLLADREARPSLPDSREEQIREEERATPLREAFMAGRASARCGVNRGYSELAWQDYRESLIRPVSRAVDDVLAERCRQTKAEGWTPEHDDTHTRGELSDAASCYALHANDENELLDGLPEHWPWEDEAWKRDTPRRMLVKAAALMLAEIERLDRARARQGGNNG